MFYGNYAVFKARKESRGECWGSQQQNNNGGNASSSVAWAMLNAKERITDFLEGGGFSKTVETFDEWLFMKIKIENGIINFWQFSVGFDGTLSPFGAFFPLFSIFSIFSNYLIRLVYFAVKGNFRKILGSVGH